MILNPRTFKSLGKFAADDHRGALSGVKIERDQLGRARLIVSDGRRLVVVYPPEGDPREYPDLSARVPGFDVTQAPGFSAVLPIASLSEAAKFPPKRPVKPILEGVAIDERNANGKVTIAATDCDSVRSIQSSPVEGKYPDVDRCFPPVTESATSITFNPVLMAELLKELFNAVGSQSVNAVRLTIVAPDMPILLEMGSPYNGRAYGLLMPIRDDAKDGEVAHVAYPPSVDDAPIPELLDVDRAWSEAIEREVERCHEEALATPK